MAVGQLFSQRFGYAVHALAYMASKPEGEITTLPELADWMQQLWPSASRTYLSTVLQQLARAGILRSHRGVAGGYSLAKRPAEITLRDVYIAMEGVRVDRCGLSLEAQCPRTGICNLSRRIASIEDEFLTLLDKHRLSAVARDLELRGNATGRNDRRTGGRKRARSRR